MKEVPVKNTGSTLSASEYTDCTSQECQNVVLNTNQILTEANLHQLTQGVSRLGNSATQFVDSGSVANVYNVTRLNTFSNNILSAYYDGMTISFAPSVTNIDGTVTVNVEGLGPIPVIRYDFSSSTTIRAGIFNIHSIITLVYNGGTFFIVDQKDAAPRLFAAATLNGISGAVLLYSYNIASAIRQNVGTYEFTFIRPSNVIIQSNTIGAYWGSISIRQTGAVQIGEIYNDGVGANTNFLVQTKTPGGVLEDSRFDVVIYGY